MDRVTVTPLLPLLERNGVLKRTPVGDGLSIFRFRSIPDGLAEDAAELLAAEED